MKYKLIERVNPANPADPKKWYAGQVNAVKFTIKHFAKEIAGRSSLTRGDIKNALNNFLDGLPVFLKTGMSVQPDEFDTLRLGLADTKEQFSTAKIRNVKIIFTPISALKMSLKDDLSFEQEQ
ncbi:MAG: DNA-binding protein [Tannerella sp.]|jgi:predicted histone-like DNA-binding protein|nr:DNA-binding protein [Tannerella sp.]